MNYNLVNIKFLRLAFILCTVPCIQHAFAQDSTSTGTAKITISFSEKDSTRLMAAILTNADTAVKGADIHFDVKKSFGLLPIEGDNTTTDENGEASVDFPTDIPSDASGNLIVVARTEDDEKVGNVEAIKTVKWGVPLKNTEPINTRALWASGNNAPWPLVITVTGLVTIGWGIIGYIFYQLDVIKKAGKHAS